MSFKERLNASSQNIASLLKNQDIILESARVDALANEAATSPLNNRPEPTQAQKEAGNYKKGRLRFNGFDIAIENPKGSLRKGVDPDGNEWSIKLNHHYGDIRGTLGADGDPVDVFLGENEQCEHVYVINQTNQDGSFDEHKVMLGFDSKHEARKAYFSNYEDGWSGLGSIIKLSIVEFKKWLKVGTTKPCKTPSKALGRIVKGNVVSWEQPHCFLTNKARKQINYSNLSGTL